MNEDQKNRQPEWFHKVKCYSCSKIIEKEEDVQIADMLIGCAKPVMCYKLMLLFFIW